MTEPIPTTPRHTGQGRRGPSLTITEARLVTREFPPAAPGAPICGPHAFAPGRVYGCTRPAGHDGPHVAHSARGDAIAIGLLIAPAVTRGDHSRG